MSGITGSASLRDAFVARNPRRRWCSGRRCANRVRVSRYYQRSKAR
ncbi:CGNR zinc finger domain-containing protein [Sinorhizobium numidicum]